MPDSPTTALTPPPRVSVILPVYNRREMLSESIRSVLRQSMRDLELLVVDDGSTDGSGMLAEEWGPPVRVIHQQNLGPYHARNRGIAEARGELIAFIDSDDRWYPDRLRSQIRIMDDPRVALVYGDMHYVDAEQRLLDHTLFDIAPPHRGRIASHLPFGNPIANSAVLMRRECFELTGPFRTDEPLAADFLKWFEVALDFRLDYIPYPIGCYHLHSGNISRDLARAYRSRIALFSILRREREGTAAEPLIEHIIFNLQLHRAILDLRRLEMRDASRRLLRSFGSGRGPSRSRRLVWTLRFVAHQIRIRSVRLARAARYHHSARP